MTRFPKMFFFFDLRRQKMIRSDIKVITFFWIWAEVGIDYSQIECYLLKFTFVVIFFINKETVRPSGHALIPNSTQTSEMPKE